MSRTSSEVEESRLTLCMLASGSKGNAVHVSDGKTSILIDAGLSGREIERRLLSKKLRPEDLDAIVISHEHSDHVQGAGVLSRRYGLPVYINELTLKAAKPHIGPLHETVHFRREHEFFQRSYDNAVGILDDLRWFGP